MDPIQRFRDASERLEQARVDAEHWTAVRRDAVAELVRDGWSYQRIADELGVSKGRVAQLAKG